MKLDVIIPSYNEEGNIKKLYEKLTESLANISYNLIFVDDGSTDNTYQELKNIYENDKRHVKVISFSRNFGKDSAIYAGIKVSTAKYTCIIDADLQQNPKYLMKMYDFLESHEEYDIVTMLNSYEKESFIKKSLKSLFYKIIKKLSDLDFKVGASDFRMFRKNVKNAIMNLSETNRFTKGIFSYIGFNTYYMNYVVEKRYAGKSKFNLKNQFRYAKEGILNFSTKPLKLATVIGTIISSVSFIYLLVILVDTLISGKDVPGYASMMCVILLLGGIELLVLGIIGEYLAKNYQETKARPIYIEKNKLGFDDNIL